MKAISNSLWSHDGKYVYFDSVEVAVPAIYREDLATHKVTRLVSLRDFHLTSLVQPTMTLAPDDSPVRLRNTGIEEIYGLDLAVE
jgi:hypothetical protein